MLEYIPAAFSHLQWWLIYEKSWREAVVIQRTSIKMAAVFAVSYIVSATLWDVFIFFTFPRNIREITSIAALILFPSSLGSILVNLAVYAGFIILLAASVAWLLRIVHQDVHLRHTALGRWVFLGTLLGLTEFLEVHDSLILHGFFGLLILVSYWLAFYRFPPQPRSR